MSAIMCYHGGVQQSKNIKQTIKTLPLEFGNLKNGK